MNSIAVWWQKNSDDVGLHLDVNIWLDSKAEQDYIEFGLKLKKPPKGNEIYIFLPCRVDQSNVKDKIKKLSEGNITKALFNEKMRISQGDGGFHTVEYLSDLKKDQGFRYCQLNESKDFNFEEVSENDCGIVGTKITINLKEHKQDISNYYRFRIKAGLDKLKTTSGENISVLDGLVKEVSFVEVCINSSRKLPNLISDILDQDQKIQSMNLFIMTDILTTFTFESQETESTRMLEKHIWNDYLDRSTEDRGVVANHWKKSDFHDYSLFVKIRRARKTWKAALGVILVLLVSGVAGNLTTRFFFPENTTAITSPNSQTERAAKLVKKERISKGDKTDAVK